MKEIHSNRVDLIKDILEHFGKKFTINAEIIPLAGDDPDHHAYTIFEANSKWWLNDSENH